MTNSELMFIVDDFVTFMNIPNELIERLSEAKHVVVLTGAGVSAESGIKTFRDPGGLWAKYNPAELASMDGFMGNTELVWSWYQHRLEIINNTQPNPGHKAIAEMADMFPKFTLITQNVDRLHHRAGSEDVIELHGNIVENYCVDCRTPYEGEANLPDNQLPVCGECGGKIRPNVVWFGEMLPSAALRAAEEAATACDLFFSAGTSAEVYPAANLPMIAKRAGSLLVEVNPNVTVLSQSADIKIKLPSGIAFPEILDKYKNFVNKQG